MNPQQPRSEDPDWTQRQLDYRSGAADLQPIKKSQVVGGGLIGVMMVLGAVVIGIMASIGGNANRAGFVVVGGAVLMINVWAFLAYRSPTHRGLGLGLWIGFGLGLLIEGVCFGIARLS